MADKRSTKTNCRWLLAGAVLSGFMLAACTSPEVVSRNDVKYEVRHWPALQHPWDCAGGTTVAASGPIVEIAAAGFVIDAPHRNIKVDLENPIGLRPNELFIGDEVSVRGAAKHGAFGQPGLDAQALFVKRLGRSFVSGSRADKSGDNYTHLISTCG